MHAAHFQRYTSTLNVGGLWSFFAWPREGKGLWIHRLVHAHLSGVLGSSSPFSRYRCMPFATSMSPWRSALACSCVTGFLGFYAFLVLLRLDYLHLVSPKRINQIAINSPKINVIDRTRTSSLIQHQSTSISPSSSGCREVTRRQMWGCRQKFRGPSVHNALHNTFPTRFLRDPPSASASIATRSAISVGNGAGNRVEDALGRRRRPSPQVGDGQRPSWARGAGRSA